ncbi:MAG: ABC transporter permease, partial [Acidimicrobiales bacterium]|nr:ABC transporter permease [Acidimicrobiales bacterium]MYI28395.1 ABC transporter permease [Acidimicrobiales bacterium]
MALTAPQADDADASDDLAVSRLARLMRPFVGVAVPATAAIAALLVGAVMLLSFGANPLVAYGELITGAFGSADNLADTAVRAMPLALVGVGICIAFRTDVINIGGEGQIILGAIAATVTSMAFDDVPRALLVPMVIVAGAIGGGFWGAIPGALKAYA